MHFFISHKTLKNRINNVQERWIKNLIKVLRNKIKAKYLRFVLKSWLKNSFMCVNTFMWINTGLNITRRKIAKLSQCRVSFPDSMGGSCSINKSIFSPIQGYLVSNRFTILRSPPARPILDGDIMSRLREINVLDFPLIETPRKVMYNFLASSSGRNFRKRKYRFCIYTRTRTNLSRTLGRRRV